MNSELIALAGAGIRAQTLLELAEDWHDANAWQRHAEMMVVRQRLHFLAGTSEAVDRLLEAVSDWHEYELRIDTCRDLVDEFGQRIPREQFDEQVIEALHFALHGREACDACIHYASRADTVQSRADRERVCAGHLETVCMRCMRIGLVVRARAVLAGRGYCTDCLEAGHRRALRVAS